MGLIRGLLALPVSGPVAGVSWIARKLAETAEAELNDPAAIRRALDRLEARLEAGEIDEAAFEAEEAVLLDRLTGAGPGR
jgi:predicted kinase